MYESSRKISFSKLAFAVLEGALLATAVFPFGSNAQTK